MTDESLSLIRSLGQFSNLSLFKNLSLVFRSRALSCNDVLCSCVECACLSWLSKSLQRQCGSDTQTEFADEATFASEVELGNRNDWPEEKDDRESSPFYARVVTGQQWVRANACTRKPSPILGTE